MKKNIHPVYKKVSFKCGCGNKFSSNSTFKKDHEKLRNATCLQHSDGFSGISVKFCVDSAIFRPKRPPGGRCLYPNKN